MNTLTYKGYIGKGYIGSVSFSEKDNVFFGKIEGINGLVNFEGESVKELTEAFHEAVDDYLAYIFFCIYCLVFKNNYSLRHPIGTI